MSDEKKVIVCPECGGMNRHWFTCATIKPKRPRINNFSADAATNRGPETMRGTLVMLQPVTEG